MKKALYILYLLLLIGVDQAVAQKHDNVWPGGLNEYPGVPGNGNYLLHFDDGNPTVVATDLHMNFESTVAAISDSSGNLLFYTNGCAIANAQGNVILDGDGLNPGVVRDLTCPTTGYICPRGAMFLPFTGGAFPGSFYVLLHMGMRYTADRGLRIGAFYFSYVNRFGNGGTGSALGTNLELIPDDFYNYLEPFAVVRHGNGRDWWIIVPIYRTNEYRVFLMNNSGVKPGGMQQIGPAMKCRRMGSSVFSPDGSKFARVQNCSALVMDFDRCTGKFSNPVTLERSFNTFGGGGVAFSPDGTKLLVSSQLAILSADLTVPIPTLDTLISTEQVAGTSLHYLQYGPDNNLYFSTLQRYKRIPTLDDPFGDNPDFDQHGVDLPVYSVRSLPNFPNYRLYDFPDSPCDTLGINTPVPVTEPEAVGSLLLVPNPSTGQAALTLPATTQGVVVISDVSGREILRAPINSDRFDFETTHCPPGLYTVQVRSAAGKVWVGKLVVQR